jgi:RAB protein geranylgeranyltransferase component A
MQTELKETMRTQLQELQLYGFAQYLLQQVDRIKSRHLFKLNILQDIDSMEQYGKTTLSKEARENIDVKLEEDLTNSCLILEDEADLLESRNTMTSDEAMDSFQVNMRQNQSLVAQINIIYSKEIKKEDYLESLKLFLKWGQIYQEHSYAGFLSPLYQGFCQFACIIPQ